MCVIIYLFIKYFYFFITQCFVIFDSDWSIVTFTGQIFPPLSMVCPLFQWPCFQIYFSHGNFLNVFIKQLKAIENIS